MVQIQRIKLKKVQLKVEKLIPQEKEKQSINLKKE